MITIQSIMAGTVLTINVDVGDEISVGQEVIILESMKMAIPIVSNEAGRVDVLKVKIGDFVDENDVLIILK